MRSWWDLGEGSGFRGKELELHRITCPFCLERGKFALEYRAQKRKPNSSKTLNFDTLRCANCTGVVMALWSAGEFGSMHGLYGFQVLPWPLKLDRFPEHWPEPVGRFWLQAHRAAADDNWDAAAVMARSSMQVALRDNGAAGRSLKSEIDDLSALGILPPHMKDWAHELRELANESAHPDPAQGKTNPEDAKDIIEFLDFLPAVPVRSSAPDSRIQASAQCLGAWQSSRLTAHAPDGAHELWSAAGDAQPLGC